MASRRRSAGDRLPVLRLKVRVTGRHPRFFRKQVVRPEPPIAAGSLVFVEDKLGRPVGTGFYNSRSTIALRMIHRGRSPVTGKHVLALLEAAIALRHDTLRLPQRTQAYRLVHAEGDGLPGLVLDRLGQHLVARVSAKGIEPFIEPIGEDLLRRFPDGRLVLRVDRAAAKIEGIDLEETASRGTATLSEEGFSYRFRPGVGHKTGFFCDQRENRVALGRLAEGRRVLDLFCNGAGFAMHAARGGARVVEAFDLDEDAVRLAQENLAANGVDAGVAQADAFDVLRELRPGRFDLVVLDPPKWVAGEADRDTGLGRYLDINRLAMASLGPGGLLLTCSCSGSLGEAHFLAVLREAALRAGRDARVLAVTGAGPDHPVALECPETRYLHAAWLELR